MTLDRQDMRRAIVSGASRGIGAATARLLMASGWFTILMARNTEALQELAAPNPRMAAVLPADLANEADLTAAIRRAITEFGPVHAMVHCAGIMVTGSADNLSLADWRRTLDVNLTAPFIASRILIPHFRKNGGGHLVFISSVAAEEHFPGNTAYGVSKAALNKLADEIREEFRTDNIAVTTLMPAATATPLWDGSGFDTKDFTQPEDVANIVKTILESPESAIPEVVRLRRVKGNV